MFSVGTLGLWKYADGRVSHRTELDGGGKISFALNGRELDVPESKGKRGFLFFEVPNLRSAVTVLGRIASFDPEGLGLSFTILKISDILLFGKEDPEESSKPRPQVPISALIRTVAALGYEREPCTPHTLFSALLSAVISLSATRRFPLRVDPATAKFTRSRYL